MRTTIPPTFHCSTPSFTFTFVFLLLWDIASWTTVSAQQFPVAPTGYTHDESVTTGGAETLTFTGGLHLNLTRGADSATIVGESSTCLEFGGKLVGSIISGVYKYSGGLAVDDNAMYGIPYLTGRVLKLDISTDTTSYIGPDFGDYSQLWLKGVVASNGTAQLIYAFPASADQVLKIDPADDSVSKVGPILSGASKWKSGAVAPNGIIYAMPADAARVLKFDPKTEEASLIGLSLGGSVHSKYYGAITAKNGIIYATPFNADRVLKIDPGDDRISFVGPAFDGSMKWEDAIMASNGCIYALPYNARQVLKIDPSTDTVSKIGMLLPSDERKWNSGVLAENNIIYGSPLPNPIPNPR